MLKLISTIMLLMIGSVGFAQDVLYGLVVDEDENPLADVKIQEMGSRNVTYTDMKGRFALDYATAASLIEITHDRYDTLRLNFREDKDIIIFLNLRQGANGYNMGGVVGYTDFKHKVPNKHLELMPYFLGQADINRQLHMLPGIEHGREGFSNLFVRGGDVDQNLMLYNGTPIYNFNHLFGLASVFHNRSIANTGVYKGIAPAKYGGRTSSVMVLESHKDAEYSDFKGEFEASPLTAGIYLESINKHKNYFTLAARRTWLDQLFPEESRRNSFNFNFHDIQANYGFTALNDDKWDFSLMNTRDLYYLAFQIEPDSNNSERVRYDLTQRWSNILASVKYTKRFTRFTSASNSVHYSYYGSLNQFSEEVLLNQSFDPNPYSQQRLNRGIQDLILRSDWDHLLSNKNHLNFGLQSNVRMFLVGRVAYESRDYPGENDVDLVIGDQSFSPTFENSLYAENTYRNTDNFLANYGLRFTHYLNGDYSNIVFEPRVNMMYRPEPKGVFKVGYNRHHQFVSQLNVGESGSIRNLWVPATKLVAPQISDLFELGYERLVGDEYAASANLYWKRMENLSTISNLDDAEDPNKDWQNSVFQGTGNAYGVELMFQKNEGYFTGWISYTFSRSTRNFPDLFEEDFLFNHDRTHMMKLYANIELYDEWELGFNFLIGSGQLFTIPIGKFYDQSGQLQLEYNTLNNYRSPFYQRFDVSVIRSKDLVGLDQEWKFYLYNALGYRNPLNINADFEDASLTELSINRTGLVFIPGVAYLVKF